eukprot:8405146-Pyramimonas_sp.AAC.1
MNLERGGRLRLPVPQGVGGRHLRSWTLSRSAVAWVSCWRCSALSSTNTLRQLAFSPSTKAK